MSKVRHVLGISGGKDSAALAIYLRKRHPELDVEYYFCDTGKELDETYKLIENLQPYLGKPIVKLESAADSHLSPFDHQLKAFGDYLPSSTARWCTRKLKLEPFEAWVGNDPVVSYVGIRGDEHREGYISKKSNIQSIFPFRRNIWSEDVIALLLKNGTSESLIESYRRHATGTRLERIMSIVNEPLSYQHTRTDKLNALLTVDTGAFNKVVFDFLKTTQYPLAIEEQFPLLENEDVLVRDDIFKLLRDSGVGVPKYYEKVGFELNGEKGEYARSRSGCYFCFFQQKIEWVWLYEQHPDKFKQAMEYEKSGYSWMDDERLEDLIKPERIEQIKTDQIKRGKNLPKSALLLDLLEEAEGEGCAACFI